jgi:hypothetical protein
MHCAGAILRAGSVEGAARAPAHVVAAWLSVLPWLAEAAGKGGVDSGGLPVMPLQSLLASLHRHLLLLRTTAAPPETGASLLGDASELCLIWHACIWLRVFKVSVCCDVPGMYVLCSLISVLAS